MMINMELIWVWPNYFGSNPEFIIPISSVTHYNIEPLKWALFDIVKKERENKEI